MPELVLNSSLDEEWEGEPIPNFPPSPVDDTLLETLTDVPDSDESTPVEDAAAASVEPQEPVSVKQEILEEDDLEAQLLKVEQEEETLRLRKAVLLAEQKERRLQELTRRITASRPLSSTKRPFKEAKREPEVVVLEDGYG